MYKPVSESNNKCLNKIHSIKSEHGSSLHPLKADCMYTTNFKQNNESIALTADANPQLSVLSSKGSTGRWTKKTKSIWRSSSQDAINQILKKIVWKYKPNLATTKKLRQIWQILKHKTLTKLRLSVDHVDSLIRHWKDVLLGKNLCTHEQNLSKYMY